MIASSSTNRHNVLQYFLRGGLAFGMTALLLVFLVVSRSISLQPETLTIRSVEGTNQATMPPPPPPVPFSEKSAEVPPPPTTTAEQLELDLSLDPVAPPVLASPSDNKLILDMKQPDFASDLLAPKASSLFSSSELDGQPRLLNRPNVMYPPNLRKKGVEEGRVVLEVMINGAGKVTVRRVISSSLPDFIPTAKSFASRARFSPPKKDGRIVNAVFNWPLLFRP
jgi:TonB family protein